MKWAVAIIVLIFGGGLWLYRRGRKDTERDQMEGVLDDLEEAQSIRRDVGNMDRDELADELRRP